MKKSLWRGSTLQFLTIIILPLTILLAAISLVSFSIHQTAMRSVVGARDERSARSAANAIEIEIDHRLYAIRSLALLLSQAGQENPAGTLTDAGSLLGDFTHGAAVVEKGGAVLAASKDPTFWQALCANVQFQSFLAAPSNPSISGVITMPDSGEQIIAVSAQIAGSGQLAVAAFLPQDSIQHSLDGIYPSSGETAIYVIDSAFQVIYHSGPATLEVAPQDHPGVEEAFKGQSGTTYVKVGRDEHVIAFSPIQSAGWAFITEESWETVSSPTLRTSQMLPLVLVPALLLAMLALWFGSRQIVRPLQKLESRAAKLSWGDFNEIEKPVGGIAEIRDLQSELAHMARQVQIAQQSLHSYIGAITKGQEAERLRLARELHDDTIQSLIALKQRVQLASMPNRKIAGTPELAELESLIEQSIDDLRRTTRALRPIYLEDLGLVAALEMLARETSQVSGLAVDFQSSGTERRLAAETELALYRMAQEALTNAIHHSQARNISVRIDFTAQDCVLAISDDGKGFEVPKTPAEFAPQGHFGLLGLYERAELIRAALKISSSPGKGTHIRIEYPYSH